MTTTFPTSRLEALLIDHLDVLRRIRPTQQEIDLLLRNELPGNSSTVSLRVVLEPLGSPRNPDANSGPYMVGMPADDYGAEVFEGKDVMSAIMTTGRQNSVEELRNVSGISSVTLGIVKRLYQEVDRGGVQDHVRQRAEQEEVQHDLQEGQQEEQQEHQVPIDRTNLPPAIRLSMSLGFQRFQIGSRMNRQGQDIEDCQMEWSVSLPGTSSSSL